jgi:hypothetical protein
LLNISSQESSERSFDFAGTAPGSPPSPRALRPGSGSNMTHACHSNLVAGSAVVADRVTPPGREQE